MKDLKIPILSQANEFFKTSYITIAAFFDVFDPLLVNHHINLLQHDEITLKSLLN